MPQRFLERLPKDHPRGHKALHNAKARHDSRFRSSVFDIL